jgi:hypothetical protein
VNQYQTKIKLKGTSEDIHNGFLVEASATLYAAIEELYEKFIKSVAKPLDRAQMLLKSDVMSSYISTPFRDVNDLTPNHLLTAIEKSQNSGASIKFSDNLVIEFLHIRRDPGWKLAGGVGHGRRDLLYFNNHHQKRSCRQVTTIGNNTCLPACCIVGAAHQVMKMSRKCGDTDKAEEATKLYKSLTMNPGKNKKLQQEVHALYDALGVKKGTALDLSHIPGIERILDINIKVVSMDDQLKFVYKSERPHSSTGYVYLVYSNPEKKPIGHYDLITNVRGFFSKPNYCEECDVAYWKPYNHRCKNTQEWWCFACYRSTCKKSENPVKCQKCNAQTHSRECRVAHENFKCDRRWTCSTCHKKRFREKIFDPISKVYRMQTDEEITLSHDCDMYFCTECKEEVKIGHRCFIKRKKFKDKIQKFLYFDVETDQSSKTHEVNYIHVIYYEPTRLEQEWSEEIKKKKGLKIFLEREIENQHGEVEELSEMEDKLDEIKADLKKYNTFLKNDKEWKGKWMHESYKGKDSLSLFCKDLMARFRGYTCLAHNLKGFDGVFILKTFLENNIIPQVICKGQKLLEIRVTQTDLRFIDSFNFLPMGLAKLPEAFGLDCGSKGFFPHFFNRPENQNYVGPYPEPKYYGVSQMSNSVRENFYKWYKEQAGKTFNFAEEMEEYCKQDVEILKQSCLAYRRLMCKKTNCDPFAYVTLASVCSAVYMTLFMPEETIARVPASGYDRSKYSYEGYEWLEYLRRYGGVPNLRHAMNGGEVKIGNYFVDGFDNNTVYEYYGCFFHGCKECFDGKLVNPDTNKRLIQSYTETMRRERWLRDQGYKVKSMWGCEWRKLKQELPNLREKIDAMKLPKPLNPRDAFYGGRTETFKVWSKGAPIAYNDVTSLYPWVNCTMVYPVGHPEIILSDFKDISEYFGIIKCTMLAPKDLYLPVLPVHAGGKLLFPLCRSCAETSNRNSCHHCEEERAIQGTWFSEEVKLAIAKGYKLMEIHSVWHFENRTRELFAPYIRRFYKMKMLSSKLPYCTVQEMSEFIELVKIKEGIAIGSPEDFKENPGLRQITKLMLNNLWGRFGMNENMSTCQFVTDFEELEKLMEDVTKEIQAIRIINEKIVQVIWRTAERDYLTCSRDTNIFVALATTAWARIRLYQELEKVGRRVLYCDTDSVIYEESADPVENLQIGSFLGEMTSELDADDYIVEFVSGGPKNYGYVTKKGKTVIKVKGFTLDSTNSEAFTFEKIKEVVLSGVGNNEDNHLKKKRRKMLQRTDFFEQHVQNAEDASAIATNQGISVYNPVRISRTRAWDIVQKAEQKLYTFDFDKRVIDPETYDTFPYGYVK